MEPQPYFRGDIVRVNPGTPYSGFLGRVDSVVTYEVPGFSGTYWYVDLTRMQEDLSGELKPSRVRLYALPSFDCTLVEAGPERAERERKELCIHSSKS